MSTNIVCQGFDGGRYMKGLFSVLDIDVVVFVDNNNEFYCVE
jgi:hypothetical protein